MSQVYLFTGENAFDLDFERRRWIGEFREKHGDHNLLCIDGKNCELRNLLDETGAAPFLSDRRLVVIDGIPALEKEEFIRLIENIHPSTLLLIVDPKPDKRLSITKEILANATVKTFPNHRRPALVDWLCKRAVDEGSSLTRPAAEHLIDVVGEGQMFLATELRKLATFACEKGITSDDIDTLCMLSEEQAVWKLMDLLVAGKGIEALVFAEELFAKGESPHALWARLLWIVSQLVLVAGAAQEGSSNPATIAKQTGVPFPTVSNVLPLARRLKMQTLLSLVEKFAKADVEIKTGGYRATAEAPEELLSLIDCCIVHVSAL